MSAVQVEQVQEERYQRPRELRTRVRIKSLDPWSILKSSFFFSFLVALATFVAVWLVWLAFTKSGLMAQADKMIEGLTGTPADQGGLSLEQFINTQRVLGAAALLAAVAAVITPVFLTLATAFYNLTAYFMGGVEATLAQDADEEGEVPDAVPAAPVKQRPASKAKLKEGKGEVPPAAPGATAVTPGESKQETERAAFYARQRAAQEEVFDQEAFSQE